MTRKYLYFAYSLFSDKKFVVDINIDIKKNYSQRYILYHKLYLNYNLDYLLIMSYRKSLITSFNVLALNCVLHSLEIERSLKSIINCNICLFIIFSRIFPFRSYRIRDDLFASVVFRLGYVNSLDVITPFHVLHRWKHLKHIVYSIHVMCVLCFRIKI